MNRRLRYMIALLAIGGAYAQRVAVLDIEVANTVVYRCDVADADKRAISPAPVPIRRLTFALPHSGQRLIGSAVMDWNRSN